MTKTEFINKFSNSVGIIETDAKVYFDILLRKLSLTLKSNQAIFISNFGYFYLIKGKLKKPALGEDADEIAEELIDIILYSEEEKLSQSETKGFVFNVPFNDDEDYNPVDSYFSLSIGKPVIHLMGVLGENSYTPTSGFEYRRWMESKVEELIKNSKIINSEERFPTLIIDASSYNSNQVHLEQNKDVLESLIEDVDKSDTRVDEVTQKNKLKNIAWDFGENYSEKISLQSILELADERINADSNVKVNKTENNTPKDDKSEEEKILDVLLENENSEKDVDLNNTNEPEKTEEALNDFDEIKSTPDDIPKMDAEISDEEFWKSTSKYFETYNPPEMASKDENEFIENKSTEANLGEFSAKENKIKLVDENNKLSKDKRNKSYAVSDNKKSNFINHSKSKKKSNWLIIFVIMLFIVLVAALYWYFQFYKNSASEIKITQSSLSSDNANIIERDYKIPVTYPYLPESSIMDSTKSEIMTEDFEKSEASKIGLDAKQNETKTNDAKQIGNSKYSSGSAITVGDNIYRYGNIFVVQVASFRSKSIAENEAGKYRNKGYNSFVEQAEITGRGLWYRIRVGDFSSIDEAKNFISKNNR